MITVDEYKESGKEHFATLKKAHHGQKSTMRAARGALDALENE